MTDAFLFICREKRACSALGVFFDCLCYGDRQRQLGKVRNQVRYDAFHQHEPDAHRTAAVEIDEPTPLWPDGVADSVRGQWGTSLHA